MPDYPQLKMSASRKVYGPFSGATTGKLLGPWTSIYLPHAS